MKYNIVINPSDCNPMIAVNPRGEVEPTAPPNDEERPQLPDETPIQNPVPVYRQQVDIFRVFPALDAFFFAWMFLKTNDGNWLAVAVFCALGITYIEVYIFINLLTLVTMVVFHIFGILFFVRMLVFIMLCTKTIYKNLPS